MLLRFLPVLLVLLAACERPFVAAVEPSIRPVEPEVFETVQTADSLTLRLSVTSFRAIDAVTVDGHPLAREARSDLWTARVPLGQGVNAFVVRATDVGGVTGRDTLYAVRLESAPLTTPLLPEPRGAHTLTRLPDGRWLVTGGTDRAGGTASDAAFVLDADRQAWTLLPARMQHARAEHTASLLPDGRVLLLGGRVREGSRAESDFVADAELFDPQTNTFSPLPVEGAPIVRARHTAVLRRVGETAVVELLGGEGTIGFTPSDFRFGVRDDLRPFALRADRLEALSPGRTSGQGSTVEPLAGHLTERLTGRGPDGDGEYLIAGAFFSERGTDNTALRLWVRAQGLALLAAPPLRTARTRAGALALGGLGVLVLGGTADSPLAVVDTGELYVTAARRWLRLPPGWLSDARYAAALAGTAAEACYVGGFEATGAATRASACFRLLAP